MLNLKGAKLGSSKRLIGKHPSWKHLFSKAADFHSKSANGYF